MNGDLSKVHPINEDLITEEATHAWYADNEPLHPYEGKNNPKYTGMKDRMTVGPDGEEIASKSLDDTR